MSGISSKPMDVISCNSSDFGSLRYENGVLYHVTDTNEFYFCWNGETKKLNIFSTDKSESDSIGREELSSWLEKNNYITGLSLSDELVKLLGEDLENIITKEALDNYASNNLLTKDEIGLLEDASSLLENISELKKRDDVLYNNLQSLAKDILDIRKEADSYIKSGELDTELNKYLESAIAESTYVKISDGVTKEYLKEKGYIDIVTLNEKLEKYNIDKSITREETDELYLKKESADKFITKTDADKKYVTKLSISGFQTKSEIDDTLNSYAQKLWVDQYYLRKDKNNNSINDYMLIEDAYKIFLESTIADDKFLSKTDAEKEYITKSDAEHRFIDPKELKDYLSNYISNDDSKTFAQKLWVDQYFMRKGEISGIKNAMVLNSDYSTLEELKKDRDIIREGFYYLGGENEKTVVLAVHDGNGNKTFVSIEGTSLETEAMLYFGGDDVNW